MSHFSTLKVQIKKAKIAEQVCKQFGWVQEHVAEYENPWKAANEMVKNCTLYKDTRGKVKMVVDKLGNVIHDTWSMGTEAFQFLQKYSEEFIRTTAKAEGAQVTTKGVDNDGNIVLEIEYAY